MSSPSDRIDRIVVVSCMTGLGGCLLVIVNAFLGLFLRWPAHGVCLAGMVAGAAVAVPSLVVECAAVTYEIIWTSRSRSHNRRGE